MARVRGYELIPDILPHTPMPPYRPSPLRLRDTVRDTLVYWRGLPEERRAKPKPGLPPVREAEVLKAWHLREGASGE